MCEYLGKSKVPLGTRLKASEQISKSWKYGIFRAIFDIAFPNLFVGSLGEEDVERSQLEGRPKAAVEEKTGRQPELLPVVGCRLQLHLLRQAAVAERDQGVGGADAGLGS